MLMHRRDGRLRRFAGEWSEVDDDQTLVAAAQKEPDAFAAIYTRYAQRIYLYVRARVVTDDDALDITQQVFVKSSTLSQSIDGPTPLSRPGSSALLATPSLTISAAGNPRPTSTRFPASFANTASVPRKRRFGVRKSSDSVSRFSPGPSEEETFSPCATPET